MGAEDVDSWAALGRWVAASAWWYDLWRIILIEIIVDYVLLEWMIY